MYASGLLCSQLPSNAQYNLERELVSAFPLSFETLFLCGLFKCFSEKFLPALSPSSPSPWVGLDWRKTSKLPWHPGISWEFPTIPVFIHYPFWPLSPFQQASSQLSPASLSSLMDLLLPAENSRVLHLWVSSVLCHRASVFQVLISKMLFLIFENAGPLCHG